MGKSIMQPSDILLKLAGIIAEMFDANADDIGLATTADDVDGWDSLSHAIFMMRVEREFGQRFQPKDVYALGCVGDLVELLRAKLAA